MTGSQVSLLCETLAIADSRLRTLALVNAQLTDRSFSGLLQWLRDSLYVRSLDLSSTQMCTSSQHSWSKLIEAVREHSSLRSLNLSHNRLFEDQPQKLSES